MRKNHAGAARQSRRRERGRHGRRRTGVAARHHAHDEPRDDLEEVIRAGDFAEAVPVRDGACFRARRPEVAQGHVRLEIREFCPL